MAVDHRLDSLSTYLFESDASLSESYSSVPSVNFESTQSPSDNSTHSSSSNYSPRSASGSVKSPAEAALEISKNDIDDINNLLFSFGAPYDSASTDEMFNKDSITWPASATSPNSAEFPYSAPVYADHHAAGDHTSQTANGQHRTSISHEQKTLPMPTTNGSLYPSLQSLSSKPIKPLPHGYKGHNDGHAHHRSQHSPHYSNSSLGHSGYDYLAPQPSIPTPYIEADQHREPTIHNVQLLSRAPPLSQSMRHLIEAAEDSEQTHRVKQGVSNLRSTVEEDELIDSPEQMLEEDFEVSTREISPSSSSAASAVQEERITLPPIKRSEGRDAEFRLPSLRSLLSDESAMDRSPSGPSNAGSESPHSVSHIKRSTPSRQFYPSLASLASRHHVDDVGTARRPSTGEKLDKVIRGVGRFKMNSCDETMFDEPISSVTSPMASTSATMSEDDEAGSEDDISPSAVYKRSRMRTKSPAHFGSGSDSEDDADTPVKTEESPAPMPPSPEELIRRRRLFVIQVLMARANQLYRESLASKVKQLPALARVKEEEMD